MPPLKGKAPSCCLHKRSGRAVVRLNGKDYYLASTDRLKAKKSTSGGFKLGLPQTKLRLESQLRDRSLPRNYRCRQASARLRCPSSQSST